MQRLYCFLLLLTLQTFAAAQPLLFKQGIIQAPPPGAETLAGYLKIENPGKIKITINHISSSDFERIEIHETTLQNGIHKMNRLSQLVIAANSSIELKPGGLHLMLIGPRKIFYPDDLIQLQFRQTDQTEHIIEVRVQRLPSTSHAQH